MPGDVKTGANGQVTGTKSILVTSGQYRYNPGDATYTRYDDVTVS